ncbi:MAG: L-rhamnose mutarotase [Planctomycetota bacterium]
MPKDSTTRYGMTIGLKDDMVEEYLRLHANVWPEVDAMIGECNIRNMSIYIHQLPDGHHYLFMYLEYIGDDFEADMRKMAADPMTQKWWKETEPCQQPLHSRKEGELWAQMKEVVHHW